MKSIFFIICFVALFILIDNVLSCYGKGFNLLNNKISFDFNTDFDSLKGFKIEEENFIQVIGNGTVIDSIVIEKVNEYSFNRNYIYCKIIDKNHNLYYIRIQFVKKANIGNKIVYKIIPMSNLEDNLFWYDVENLIFINTLEIFQFIVSLLIIVAIFFFMKQILLQNKD